MIGRAPIASLFVLLAAGIAACGSGQVAPARVASTNTSVNTSTNIVEPVLTVSRQLGPIDADDYQIVDFGKLADERDRSATIALSKRYFAVAAAEDGAKACAMLYPPTALEPVIEHADWGVRGKTCPVVLSAIFRLHHSQIEAELHSFNVVRVRTDPLNCYLLLRFPESSLVNYFSLRRVNGAWVVSQVIARPVG